MRLVRISRSQPISRVLLRGARTRPMTAIRLGVALPRRSSHLPADLASSLGLNLFVRLLGVAPDGGCRVSPAPDGVSQSGATRLCGPVPRLRRPLARSTYCGWALPSILLCGARTFLCPNRFSPAGSDGLAGFGREW